MQQNPDGYVLTQPPDPKDLLTSSTMRPKEIEIIAGYTTDGQPRYITGYVKPKIDPPKPDPLESKLLLWKFTMVMIVFPLLHLGGWAVWSLLEGNPDFPIRVFNLLTVMVLGGLVWSIQPQPK